MDLLSGLNPEQQEAVRQTDGPLLILAGAGSGKTRVIAHRIAHLVSSRIAGPDRILAVTFTNKAAEEMRTRVEALLGVDCRQMWISTFHALCARLLRREGPHIGLPRDFVIYDSADQLTVMKRAMRELGVDDVSLAPRLALSRISHAKNRMEGPETFAANVWSPRDQLVGKLYEMYLRALRGYEGALGPEHTCGRCATPTRWTSTTCCSRPWTCSSNPNRSALATARSSGT
jgi:DNA helicase-2/ATP-dependent DNA helicase PcrA